MFSNEHTYSLNLFVHVCTFHISIMQIVTPKLTAAAKMIAVMEEMLATNAESELCCTVIKAQSEICFYYITI